MWNPLKFLLPWLVACQAITNSNLEADEATNGEGSGNNFNLTKCTTDGSQFRCLVDGACIPGSRRCDGQVDCADGSDETVCPDPRCGGEGWFRCQNSHCISSDWLCDGEDDCLDWSDERADVCPTSPTPASATTCAGTDFRCDDGLCLPASWTCDGAPDCRAGEDEAEALCGSRHPTCQEGEFTCSPGDCIPSSWRCDGESECKHGEDESVDECGPAGPNCLAEEGWWRCKDGSRCLAATHLCDGKSDCADSSDEAGWCSARPGCSSTQCAHGCLETEAGPACYCRPGYRPAGAECLDRDECEEWGVCSQTCTNNPGGYNCSCLPGYTALSETGSCLADQAEPILFFSTISEVRALKVRSMQYFPISTARERVVGLGWDGPAGRLYWTEVAAGRERVVWAELAGEHKTTVLIQAGLDMPEDLVVDERHRNLYLSDSGQGRLAVCSLASGACAVLLAGLERPRALALHAAQARLLYTDWGSQPVVATVGLDGSNRRDLVTTGLRWPNGLTIDLAADRFYWSDAHLNTIESARMDGTDRRRVVEREAQHPFSLAVFEDTLYWSDWGREELLSCNKYTGKNITVLVKEAGVRPMGLVITHPLLSLTQSKTGSPCNPSPCSHVCLPRISPSPGHTCACPPHLLLSPTNSSHCETGLRPRLLLAARSSLYTGQPQSPGNSSYSALASVHTGTTITSMATTATQSIAYLVLSTQAGPSRQLVRFNLTSGHQEVLHTSPHISSLSFAAPEHNLYWTDVQKRAVMVFSLLSGISMPALLTNSTPHSLLYVAEQAMLVVGLQGELLLVRLAAGSVERVKHPALVAPSALAHSAQHHCLCVGDSGARSILHLDWSSRSWISVMQVGPVSNFALLAGRLYWAERGATTLFWLSMSDPTKMSWQALSGELAFSPADSLQLGVLTGLGVDSPSNTSCSRLRCSHTCYSHRNGAATCACPPGHSLDRDGITCHQHCGPEVFNCGEGGECLPAGWQCDGTRDCSNGADEVNCTLPSTTTCDPASQFTCYGHGFGCIPISWRCDGDADCQDGSDEGDDCPPRNCGADRAACASGNQCILPVWLCDGERDCLDGSDEHNCSMSCAADQFACQDGTRCIQKGWQCDGRPDCADNSDESNCTNIIQVCSVQQFQCANQNCISKMLFCDGDDDCGDGSDEAETVCHRRTDDAPIAGVDCAAGEFSCGGMCLAGVARCNGTAECAGREDELDCSLCGTDTFFCESGERCVPTSWQCDGTRDCRDGSDELDCSDQAGGQRECEGFQCESGECLPLQLACNARPDCADGSDEDVVRCSAVCQPGSCSAHQLCLPTPTGPVCRCEPGFLAGEAGVCRDQDECSLLSSCAQTCNNTKGGFKCGCDPGYTVEGRQCRAGGESPKLLYAVKNNINGLLWAGTRFEVELELTSHAFPVRCFDYNPELGKFYWTSMAGGIIGSQSVESPGRNQVWLAGLRRPDQLAVDWITGNVYYTEQGPAGLTVCSPATTVTSPVCVPLPTPPVTSISLLRLDPDAGLMFLAGFSRPQAGRPTGAIYPFTMSGRAVAGATVLGFPKTGIPSGLALDPATRRVYWTDSTTGDISMCSYTGSDCQQVTVTPLQHPNFLAFYEAKLYWLAGSRAVLQSYDLLELHTQRDVLKLPEFSHSLRFVHSSLSRQPAAQPCRHLNCSGLCLLQPGRPSCACPRGSVPRDSQARACTFPDRPLLPALTAATQVVTTAATPLRADQTNAAGQSGDPTVREVRGRGYSSNHGIGLALVIAALVAVVVLVALVLYCKHRKSKQHDFSLTFTNQSFGQAGSAPPTKAEPSTVQAEDHELNSVQIVKQGSAVGYDNPGFGDSPNQQLFLDREPRLSTLTWPESSIGSSDPVICVGSSTTNIIQNDTFQEPSLKASSYGGVPQRHFSVADDEEQDPQFHHDSQRLIK